MKPSQYLSLAVLLVAAVAAIWIAPSGEEAPLAPPGQTLDAQPSTQSPGMIVHIDPVTGERLETAPEGLLVQPDRGDEEVTLVQEPAPGGGVMVLMRGQYHQSMVATVGESESVTVECVPKDQAADPSDRVRFGPWTGGSDRHDTTIHRFENGHFLQRAGGPARHERTLCIRGQHRDHQQ